MMVTRLFDKKELLYTPRPGNSQCIVIDAAGKPLAPKHDVIVSGWFFLAHKCRHPASQYRIDLQ
jgi:hypothetical protein